jgi:hypothetical protein
MATDTERPALKKGDRVVATESLRGVPEGTAGKLRIVNGLGAWMRVWVQWDNGVWMGSIGPNKLTSQRDWPDFQRRREEAAKEAAKPKAEVTAAPAEAASAGDGDAPSAATSKVPAHLLERAKQARERKAAAASGG